MNTYDFRPVHPSAISLYKQDLINIYPSQKQPMIFVDSKIVQFVQAFNDSVSIMVLFLFVLSTLPNFL
jgi:hypothetical protein